MTNIDKPLPAGTRVRVVTMGASTPGGMLVSSKARLREGVLVYRLDPHRKHEKVAYRPDDSGESITCMVDFRAAADAPPPFGVWVIGDDE